METIEEQLKKSNLDRALKDVQVSQMEMEIERLQVLLKPNPEALEEAKRKDMKIQLDYMIQCMEDMESYKRLLLAMMFHSNINKSKLIAIMAGKLAYVNIIITDTLAYDILETKIMEGDD